LPYSHSRIDAGFRRYSGKYGTKFPVTTAQQLRVLAEAKGQSPAEWVSKTITSVIDAELYDLLAKMIKNMPDQNRQKFLRELGGETTGQ
jgi:hypothetical protein